MSNVYTCLNCGYVGPFRIFDSVETAEDARGCYRLLQCLSKDCKIALDEELVKEQQATAAPDAKKSR